MSSSSNKKKMLILRSSDNQEFEVEESVAIQSVAIKNMVEDDYTTVPLPNVTSKCLAMIIEYLKMHADSKVSEDDLKKFDDEFVDKTMSELGHLVLAANYLEIQDLLQLICTKMANKIKDQSVEEVRKTFNIKNDYTPEEEEAVRSEHAWAFEK